jgi:hypothetical protein
MADDPAVTRGAWYECPDRLSYVSSHRHHDYLAAGERQAVATHKSPRKTKRYDRTGDEITLDEVERIAF